MSTEYAFTQSSVTGSVTGSGPGGAMGGPGSGATGPAGGPDPGGSAPGLVRWGGRLLLAGFAILIALNGLWIAQNYRRLKPAGRSAPDFSVRRIDDTARSAGTSEFHLEAERGHPVLIDFWATWCGPCKESLPILDAVYGRLGPRGLRAIAIETEAAESRARAFVDRLGLKLPIGLDEANVSARYGVSSIPHMVLVGRDGQIRRVFHGVHSADELEKAVEAAGLD